MGLPHPELEFSPGFIVYTSWLLASGERNSESMCCLARNGFHDGITLEQHYNRHSINLSVSFFNRGLSKLTGRFCQSIVCPFIVSLSCYLGKYTEYATHFLQFIVCICYLNEYPVHTRPKRLYRKWCLHLF